MKCDYCKVIMDVVSGKTYTLYEVENQPFILERLHVCPECDLEVKEKISNIPILL